MSWKGNYWGPEGAVQQARNKFLASEQTPRQRISLASAYYSAANRTMADLKNLRWTGMRHLNQALGLAVGAVNQIDEAWWGELDNSAILKMDADAIEVSCSVYLRYGWMKKGGRKNLLKQLLIFSSQPELVATAKPHTLAFLQLHWFALDPTLVTDSSVSDVWELASEAALCGEFAQAGRVYWQLSKWYPKDSLLRHQLVRAAKEAAEKAGATDQLAKMGVR